MKRSALQIMTKLLAMVRPLLSTMLLAILMGTIGHFSATFVTVFSSFALLLVLGIEVPFSLHFLFTCILIFALVRGFLRYAEQASNHYIAFKLLALIRDRVFTALRRLCPAKLEGKDKGNLIQMITSDIEMLEVFFAHTISPICIAVLFSLGMSIFIAQQHILLGLLAIVAYISVGVLLPLYSAKTSGDIGKTFRNKAGDLSSFILESLRGLQEILQFNHGAKRLKQIQAQTQALLKEEEELKRATGFNMALSNAIILFFDIAMLLLASSLGGFKSGLIATLALMSSFGPVLSLSALGTGLQHTLAAGGRVLDILEESPVVEDITGKKQTTFAGAEVKNLDFAYQEESILQNISISFPKEGIVGIEGRSGSGKSTLLKLLMRFWQAEEGTVQISGKNIENINTDDLRNMESFITQETHLFHDSIKNNLKIAKLHASDAEIIEACKKASVHDFIMSLPKGYNTEVGELGETLSGGERQRLGLARAFLHQAPFLLLDEPTSNLDRLNEALILKSLHEERKKKSIVLVSHRKSTMAMVDQHYNVEHGRIS